MSKPVFERIKDIEIFKGSCTILNDTLAWDISGDGDTSNCINIDPDTLYALPMINEKTA